ncbi:hypothetical protein [Streptomyces sp. 142MFCol3.1]|uniref:hypothetical protein n=1 Tax=Streptomyces sp. 142MFCol3.1 TaxID=1172179 RepID=UPI001319C5A9|nr:hypothetical protein [Streptomyces sp. 142MFCol3.1]
MLNDLLHPKQLAGLAAAAVFALGAAGCSFEGGPPKDSGAEASAAQPSRAAPDSGWHYDYVGASRGARLTAVTATAADDAWAVGTVDGDTGAPRNLVLHYDGHRWADRRAARGLAELPMESALLRSSGPENVWLFAGTETRRFDGKAWRTVPAPYERTPADAPAAFGLSGPVRGAAVLDADDVWAVAGSSTARHWDGGSWHDVKLPASASTLATGPAGDLWAFGAHHVAEHKTQPAAMRWDGHGWRSLAMPEIHHTLPNTLSEDAVVAQAAVRASDDAWAQVRYDASRIGSDGEETPQTEIVMLHWDGHRWSRTATVPCCTGPMAPDAHGSVLLNGKLRVTADHGRHRLRRPAPVPGRSSKVTARDRDQALAVTDMTPIPGTRQVMAVGSITSAPHIQYFFHRPVVARYTPGAG